MPSFRYQGLTADGEKVRGVVEAADRVAALDQIAVQGLIPVDLSEGAGHQGRWWEREINLFGAPKVAPRHLIDFFAAFAILAEAKVPLADALRFSQLQVSDRRLVRVIGDLERRIANGDALAVAMQGQGDVFPERVQTLIAVGEASNTLDLSARRAADMLMSEAQFGAELRAALIYPVILLVMASLVMALVIFHLVPTLLPVFASTGSAPPSTLQAMNAVRQFLVGNWIAVLAGLALLGMLPRLIPRQVAAIRQKATGWIPWLRNYRRERETLRFARTFGLMLESGATVTQALKSAATAMPAPEYAQLLEDTRAKVEAGGKLADTLGSSAMIHPLVQGLLRVGEQTDRLADVLATASAALAKSTERRLQTALRLVTPALTLVIGLVVGGMVFSVISAILDLNDVAL